MVRSTREVPGAREKLLCKPTELNDVPYVQKRCSDPSDTARIMRSRWSMEGVQPTGMPSLTVKESPRTEVDTAGDGFFATFDGPARAAKCARAIIEGVKSLGIEIRAGVHTGEVETIAGKIGGMGVVIGSRIGAKAQGSEVLASQTVKDLTAGSGLVFEDAGEHELKGVPERWHLYRVRE
jgi:class 3 adenylate cyclase